MSDIDLDGALEALSEDLPDELEPADSSAMVEPVVEDNPDTESFTGFDPSTLPEDMQAVYRSMQADYTRKTQDLAEMRRNFESFSENGVDPNEALEAVSLWQRMNTDPEFASSVAQNIQARLEELGYANSSVTDSTPIDNNSYDGLPPELAQELEQMRQFRESFAQEQQHQQIMSELDAAEQTIRTTNPNYKDSDIEAIYSLAYSTDGDLMAAQQAYHQIQQNLLSGYLQQKTVPHGATPTPNAPSSIPAKEFSSLDEAHKAAMEAVRNIS
jgi:hypothetical protein